MSELLISTATTDTTADTTADSCCVLSAELRLADVEAARLADLFKAIGHPVRLQIVDLLSRYGGQACVCDIEGQFDLSQPTVSHHLKILRTAGLIDCEKRGVWYYYFVRPHALDELRGLLGEFAGIDRD
jgi:ArsR family transcriptional regulator